MQCCMPVSAVERVFISIILYSIWKYGGSLFYVNGMLLSCHISVGL